MVEALNVDHVISVRAHTLSNALINPFLESLIALTKERDALALEQVLKQTIVSLIDLLAQQETQSIQIYRLKDISKLFLSAISLEHIAGGDEVPEVLCQQLLDCYNLGERSELTLEDGRMFHFFPLKHATAYRNSVIVIEAQYTDASLTQAIVNVLDIYQNYTGLLNDNERDTLTGLLNRKTFDQKINKVLSTVHSRVMRQDDHGHLHYFIAIFDIDHFKRVNDEFGHLIGDEVLLLMSQLMAKSFRESDPLFRFGGEEFVGIFGCAQASDIQLVLHRFTEKLQTYQFPQVGKVTVSVGYVELTNDSTPTQVVDRADLALYYAKNHGRNQACSYDLLKAAGLLTEDIKEGEIELF